MKGIGLKFLEETSFSIKNKTFGLKRYPPAPPFKEYPNTEAFMLPLEESWFDEFFKVIAKRRSQREYSGYPITLKEISLLCFAAQGITGKLNSYLLRTAPSAGALYPIETYLAVNYSREIPQGLYHLNVRDFSLELIKEGYFGGVLTELALFQEFFSSASVIFLWSAVIYRTLSKYGDRGIRYIFMDVAHICQNMLLAAQALELKACPVGAFFDVEIAELLGLDPEEEPIVYAATVGK